MSNLTALLKLAPYTVTPTTRMGFRRQIVYEGATVIMTLDGLFPDPSAEQYAALLNGAHRAGMSKVLAALPPTV